MKDVVVVLVTCGKGAEARRIARTLVAERLAACVNIVPRIESIYRWKGRVERAREVLLAIKTTRRRYPALERRVRELHSYDLPEIVALPLHAGSASYLRWVAESVEPG